LIKKTAYQPIGIFDSGIGGLTVANAVSKRLPNESIIYFGDTAHLPYGDKSADAIRYYCLRIVKFLLENNCKMIVIACNSASSAAYQVLVDFFGDEVFFVNVIDPLVDDTLRYDFDKIGVIATKATISSGVYKRKLVAKRPDIKVAELATPLLAPMIEEGFYNNSVSKAVLENYLSNDALKDIDALLLACTHYPLIIPAIDAYYQGKVKIFDSNEVVADSVEKLLQKHQLINDSGNPPTHQFYVSDYTRSFEQTAQLFYSAAISLEKAYIW